MKKLELLNLTKSFSNFKALSNVSIELLSGETHALMGENGAGKTTLIKVLAGILKPDQIIMKIDNTIQNILGGIRRAIPPADAITPAAIHAGYPLFTSSGYAITLIAAAIAVDEPEIAPNKTAASKVA